ncbi:MAG: hypothetical protein LBO09_01290 [Candidatus Peribacteria bacterium]|jgi:hypothetical protein|nr:hypothetical protein [Candidatus Peribacteria bacterium]
MSFNYPEPDTITIDPKTKPRTEPKTAPETAPNQQPVPDPFAPTPDPQVIPAPKA